MTATGWALAFAAVLFASGLAAAVARPHALATLVAGQLGFLGAILAVVVLLGEVGRVLVVAATAIAAAHAGLVLALGGGDVDEPEGKDPRSW